MFHEKCPEVFNFMKETGTGGWDETGPDQVSQIDISFSFLMLFPVPVLGFSVESNQFYLYHATLQKLGVLPPNKHQWQEKGILDQDQAHTGRHGLQMFLFSKCVNQHGEPLPGR